MYRKQSIQDFNLRFPNRARIDDDRDMTIQSRFLSYDMQESKKKYLSARKLELLKRLQTRSLRYSVLHEVLMLSC